MGEVVTTNLGRVQPIFRGTWDGNTTYNILDIVFQEPSQNDNTGGGSYISLQNGNIGKSPINSNNRAWWQQIASRGARGIQGPIGQINDPDATAHILNVGENPTAAVTATGDNSGKTFHFNFGIPSGPYGFTSARGNVETLPTNSDPTIDVQLDLNTNEVDIASSSASLTNVSVISSTFLSKVGGKIDSYSFFYNGSTWQYNDQNVDLSTYGISYNGNAADGDYIIVAGKRELIFSFGIPAANGEGARQVDGIGADGNGNVQLYAVRFNTSQNLNDLQKTYACDNIGAIKAPTILNVNSFLQCVGTSDSPSWITTSINGISLSAIDAVVT